MIILDIETSGLTGREGICQIGAFEYENSDNYFLEDCRINAECYTRLTKGKGFFSEYNKFPIPEYLKNDNL